jgi:hypothetical protein
MGDAATIAMDPLPPTLLVADADAGAHLMRRALGASAIVWAVTDPKAAFVALDRGVDLLVCGPSFDDSRMFDFLDEVRRQPRFAGLGVACVHLASHPLPSGSDAYRIACEATGVDLFVDWSALRRGRDLRAAEACLAELLVGEARARRDRRR